MNIDVSWPIMAWGIIKMMLRKKNNISINFSNLKLLIFLIWRLAMIITLCQILLVWYDYKCLFLLVGYHRWSYKQFRSDGEMNIICFQHHILLAESKLIPFYAGNKSFLPRKEQAISYIWWRILYYIYYMIYYIYYTYII